MNKPNGSGGLVQGFKASPHGACEVFPELLDDC